MGPGQAQAMMHKAAGELANTILESEAPEPTGPGGPGDKFAAMNGTAAHAADTRFEAVFGKHHALGTVSLA
eukprot:14241-Lingulodinium_polyedra.AAC.1